MNKQIVEVKQIYLALTLPEYGWKHHPAVKMCEEALMRGMNCKLIEQFEDWHYDEHLREEDDLPWWWGYPDLVESHRRALIAKLPSHYQAFWPELEGRIEYWWPTKHIGECYG